MAGGRGFTEVSAAVVGAGTCSCSNWPALEACGLRSRSWQQALNETRRIRRAVRAVTTLMNAQDARRGPCGRGFSRELPSCRGYATPAIGQRIDAASTRLQPIIDAMAERSDRRAQSAQSDTVI
jgi:hypothetical protein